MAVLSDADRFVLRTNWIAANDERARLTKAELAAALNAIDDFMHNNAAAINNAFPEPAKSTLSARQKARVLVEVLRRRFEVGV